MSKQSYLELMLMGALAEGYDKESVKEGIKIGVEAFAVYNNGEQLVGVQRIPIKSVFEEIKSL
jgi:hypothetical protein